MDIFEWTEQTALSPSNLNEMQNILNDNIAEYYSTDEIKTNKVWINNKPIYRRTFILSSVVDGNNYFGDTSSIQEYINAYGIVHRSNGNHVFINSSYNSGVQAIVGLNNYSGSHSFLLFIGSISGIVDAYVTVEYTKTTD